MSRFRPFAFVSAAFFVAAPAIAQTSPACTPVIDAEIKLTTTPHHAVSIQSDDKAVIEMITTADANYVKIHGAWKRSPMTPQATVAQEQENIKNVKVYACSRLPDESVDGVPAVVYKAHSETPNVGSGDAQIWLSKATGLPLRTEEDVNTGTTRHLSIKYDYADIHAPVVK